MSTDDFQKKVTRDLKDLNTKLDLIYAEREILEDIISSIKAFSEKLTFHREHIDNLNKDLKADVRESQIILEDKVNDVKEKVEDGNETTEKLKEAIEK